MLIPPSIVWIRAGRWPIILPVILVWPIAVVLWLCLLPLLAVLLAAARDRRRGGAVRRLLLSGPLLFNVFCRLRHLRVQMRGHTEQGSMDIRVF